MFWAVHVALFLTAFILKQWLSSIFLNLPPGPGGLPLIGHFHLLAMGKLPHIALQQLSKRFGPLFHLHLGSVPVFVVSSPGMAKEFLKTHGLIIRDELWDFSRELSRASKAGQVVFNVMTRILMKKTYFGSKASGDPAIAEDASNFIGMIDEFLEVGADTDYFPYLSSLDWVARGAQVAGDKMNGFLQKVLNEQRLVKRHTLFPLTHFVIFSM
ncbi:psoralen synthase-like [Selaginella moellendorffii]|uniref:psoralen synthase-like n=1 Tax=Selaginella moellendorffii TaxID=88036 RepID=UPI000D1CFFBB|nr:psoralen synthase-like [Selaginella moellendorffii]|eukprot:XP_024543139.1 psoralen synthase-like [Selaginella moellendorffii]